MTKLDNCMQTRNIIGVDLSKRVFQIHSISQNGNCITKKKLSRAKVFEFFANTTESIVAMEAKCGRSLFCKKNKKVRTYCKNYCPTICQTVRHGQ